MLPVQKWLDGLEQELFAQGDFEAGVGLPVTPFMDRALPGISSRQASHPLLTRRQAADHVSTFLLEESWQQIIQAPGGGPPSLEEGRRLASWVQCM